LLGEIKIIKITTKKQKQQQCQQRRQ